jgi:hypothetical protein
MLHGELRYSPCELGIQTAHSVVLDGKVSTREGGLVLARLCVGMSASNREAFGLGEALDSL